MNYRNATSSKKIKGLIDSKRTGKSIFNIDKNRENRDDIRFNNKKDADSYGAELKAEFEKVENNPDILSGTITEHNCSHDESPDRQYDCKNDARANFTTIFEKA